MSEEPREVERASVEDEHTWTEQIEIAGSELVDRTKELIEEGNVRRLKKTKDCPAPSSDDHPLEALIPCFWRCASGAN
jgi:hypothetical protein